MYSDRQRRQIHKLLMIAALVYGLIVLLLSLAVQSIRSEELRIQTEIQAVKSQSLMRIWKGYARDGHIAFEALADEIGQRTPPTVFEEKDVVSDSERDELHALFTKWLQRYQFFDHVGIISSTGKELVRSSFRDGTVRHVPLANLQDKSTRDYIKLGLLAEPNKLLLFPLSLNRENNRLEEPAFPVARFVARIESRLSGDSILVVANTSVLYALNDLKKQSIASTGRYVYLLNRDGYFILGDQLFSDAEWAFEFPSRLSMNAANLLPQVWRAITSESEGTIKTDDGLYVFTNLYSPVQDPDGRPAGYRGSLVTHLSQEAIDGESIASNRILIPVFTFFSLMYFGMCFLLLRYIQSRFKEVEQAEYQRAAESRFLSNMSHEIRNPLNGIMGLLRHIEEHPSLAPELKDDISSAMASTRHLNVLVNDILDLKKVEDGGFTLHIAPFDYNEIREALIQTNSFADKPKNLTVDVQTIPEAMPRFFIGDAARIKQIALNQLSNALKFTPEGGIITLKAGYDFATNRLSLMCKDNGIGMDAETLGVLFERFKQGPKESHKGAGIGMAITKQLVELMDGEIVVESEPGRGTTVTSIFYLAIDHEREVLRQAGKLDAVNTTTPQRTVDLSGIRVLCVDDDLVNLKVISRPLTKAGAAVTIAHSAREALDLLKANNYEIIFTDISMPDMDGVELQRAIHELNINSPVVAVTGNVMEDDVDHYMANGFAAFLPKPFAVMALYEIVHKHAKRDDRQPPIS